MLKNILSKLNKKINPIARGRMEKERKQKVIDDFNQRQKMKQMSEDYPRVRSDIPANYNLRDFSSGDRYGKISNMKASLKMREDLEKAYDKKYPRK